MSPRVTVLLSGAPNDVGALLTALCFAAREKCELCVLLADTFPNGSFSEYLDAALWEAARRGLPAPRVSVECPRHPAAALPTVGAS